jgi:hypothetical protein
MSLKFSESCTDPRGIGARDLTRHHEEQHSCDVVIQFLWIAALHYVSLAMTSQSQAGIPTNQENFLVKSINTNSVASNIRIASFIKVKLL